MQALKVVISKVFAGFWVFSFGHALGEVHPNGVAPTAVAQGRDMNQGHTS